MVLKCAQPSIWCRNTKNRKIPGGGLSLVPSPLWTLAGRGSRDDGIPCSMLTNTCRKMFAIWVPTNEFWYIRVIVNVSFQCLIFSFKLIFCGSLSSWAVIQCLSGRRSTTELSVSPDASPRAGAAQPSGGQGLPAQSRKPRRRLRDKHPGLDVGAVSTAVSAVGNHSLRTRLPALSPEWRFSRGAYLFIYLWAATLSASSLTGTAFLPGRAAGDCVSWAPRGLHRRAADEGQRSGWISAVLSSWTIKQPYLLS